IASGPDCRRRCGNITTGAVASPANGMLGRREEIRRTERSFVAVLFPDRAIAGERAWLTKESSRDRYRKETEKVWRNLHGRILRRGTLLYRSDGKVMGYITKTRHA